MPDRRHPEDWLAENIERILAQLRLMESQQRELAAGVALLKQSANFTVATLQSILTLLSPPTPVGFDIRESEVAPGQPPTGDNMAKAAKATVDLEIIENGAGVRYTLTPVDANGNPTTLPSGTPPVVGTPSDPDLTVSVDPADTSGFGLIQIGRPGGSAVSGITVAFSTTLPGATSPISTTADPVDVVPAPPGSPTGFLIQESAV